jgi:UDP-GlcNAc3NAcA epimerase
MIVLSVIGARPQFVKCAAVSRAIARHNADFPERGIREVVVHTGQHYDEEMSGVFFRELDLADVAHNLGVGSASHAVQTAGMLSGLEKLLKHHTPDLVVVHGDTNSTLAGALAAAKLGIPVAHVEAGLRSYNRAMPEEINRILVDHSSQWLFCPSESAVSNLGREGIRGGVHQIGDVMYDVLLWHRSKAAARSDLLAGMGLRPGEYALATVHRAENTDDPGRLGAVFEALNKISERGLPVVVPLHPRTRKVICEGSLETGTLRTVAPASYETMLCLELNSRVVLTDSGGVQKEAYWLGVPCVTLREETEWPETLVGGWNVLAGVDAKRILAATFRQPPQMERLPAYGDGRAAQRIVEILARI